MAAGEALLLKVPKWLSEAWSKQPEAWVADLDLDAGKLNLLGSHGAAHPVSFSVERSAIPNSCVFSARASDEHYDCSIQPKEMLHIKADLNDAAYQGMLQRRVEENAITEGNRSLLTTGPAVAKEIAKETKGIYADPAALAKHFAFECPPADHENVCLMVQESLVEAAGEGLTLQELLKQLYLKQLRESCEFVHLRDALVACSDQRIVNGEHRYFASEELRDLASQAPPRKKARQSLLSPLPSPSTLPSLSSR